MATPINPDEIVLPLLLVKAILAGLAVVLFLYYRFYWEKAKRLLPIHFFYTKWRAVRHAYALGFAAIGFTVGFSLELFGAPLGLSQVEARFISSIFEAGSLFCMLYVFFELSLEDVPHYQRLLEQGKQHHQHKSPEAEAKKSGQGNGPGAGAAKAKKSAKARGARAKAKKRRAK